MSGAAPVFDGASPAGVIVPFSSNGPGILRGRGGAGRGRTPVFARQGLVPPYNAEQLQRGALADDWPLFRGRVFPGLALRLLGAELDWLFFA